MLRKWFFGTFIVFTNGAFSYAADSIQLGKAEITKGIPGGSILTVAEIKKFLDEPSNHKPLSPALPDNLKAGSSAVFVPEDNPLDGDQRVAARGPGRDARRGPQRPDPRQGDLPPAADHSLGRARLHHSAHLAGHVRL